MQFLKIGSRHLKTTLVLIGLLASGAFCRSYSQTVQEYKQTKQAPPLHEVRAVWVVRDRIKTRASIRAIIRSMRENNLNTAIVQVRGRGDAFYRSSLVPRAEGIEAGLDPLAEFIRLARPHGIEVHAWVNAFLAADEETRQWAPKNHLMHRHPEWFIRDRLGKSLLDYSEKEWRKANVEGAFLDPAIEAVRKHNIRVILELLARYKVDGLHLDYIRYPWSRPETEYDFGRASARAAALKKISINDDERMNRLRSGYVTLMVTEVREALNQKHPGMILTAAVWPSMAKVKDHIFQEFPTWIKLGLIDYAFLMSYYQTTELHDNRIAQFYDPQINDRFVIGIGIWKNPKPEVSLHQLNSARAIGAAGICYFRADWFIDKNAKRNIERHELPRVFARRAKPNFQPQDN